MSEKIEFKPGARRLPPQLVMDAPEVPTPDKTKKTPTYNLTWDQITAIKKQAVHEAVETAWVLMMGFPVMVLTDKNGFSHEEIDKFIDDILYLHDSFEEGRITLADVHNALKDEGISIIAQEKKRRGRK